MKTVELRRTRRWERNGKPLNVSFTSLPTGYNPETDKVVETDIWGWYDTYDNTYWSRPDLARMKDEVRALLERWNYTVLDPGELGLAL